MHDWGEKDVDWGGIDDACEFIGDRLVGLGRIHVSQTKEKFGTVRVYCSFGWDSFYGIWRPSHMWVPTWWPWKLDLTVFYWINTILNKLVIPYQKWVYKHTYRKAVAKWPHLYDEIVSCADWGELFEGVVPGYHHPNYWTAITPCPICRSKSGIIHGCISPLKPANQHTDFGKVCSHGQLKRKCDICELEKQLAAQKEVIDKLLSVVRQYQAVVEANGHPDTKWSIYTEGKEALTFTKEKLK